MNKKHLWIALGIAVCLIGLAVCLLLAFLGLYGRTQTAEVPQTDAQSPYGLEDYLIEHWQFQECLWDPSANTITAIRVLDISYEDGQKVGSTVFTGDLAPETYLSQAATIAADLNTRFATGDAILVISFRSSDRVELFSVDSVGNISTCWNTEP